MKISTLKMTFTIIFCSLLILIFCDRGTAFETQLSHDTVDSEISQSLESLIGALEDTPDMHLAGELIYTPDMLRPYYSRRNYLPVWSHNNDLSRANILVATIAEVREQGLNSEYYHLKAIKNLINSSEHTERKDVKALSVLDLLLTDSFFKIGQHLSSGSIDPVSIEAQWFVRSEKLDMESILDDALKDNTIRDTLIDLLPPQKRYEHMKKRLDHYRDLAANGGWPSIQLPILLKRGVNHDTVKKLKKRLMASGDMEGSIKLETDFFDDTLKRAVIRFQKRHALSSDGIVGPETATAMNVPVKYRVRQMEANMERMRWMARSFGHRYLEVNIADFKLNVHEYGHTVLTMDVVVGKPFWYTPVFSDEMRYIVINPAWNIPQTIAWEEIVPKVKSDASYLLNQNIKIVKNLSDDNGIGVETIDWTDFTEKNFPYWFRQDPGARNPLGQIKFMFPNRFNVYLHDTPARHLFSSSSRAFSHGCIRVSKPLALTEYLLNGDPDWTQSQIVDTIDSGQTKKVFLSKPINVHIVYLTAWIDDEGALQFRNDIYGRDERLVTALLTNPFTLN